MDGSYSCADLFNDQPNGSIKFSHGQHETDAYANSDIHVIISYRRLSNYGLQMQIYTNLIVIRHRNIDLSFTNWQILCKL